MKISIIILLTAIIYGAEPKIVRPCKFNNYNCIRANLAANSYCKTAVKGTIPNVYYFNKFEYETPFFNSSFVETDIRVQNHNYCYVSEFFINTVTNHIVLGINCPNLRLDSDRLLIQHVSLNEDSYYRYHINSLYPLIRLNIDFKYVPGKKFDLCKSHVFAEVVRLPIFDITPLDAPTANFLSEDLSLMSIYERENFYYRGYPLARIFIDSILCDFDCPVTIPVL